jgi:carbon storage regulator CsrA
LGLRKNRTKECVMLVLTRKQQERIHIGENITITVVRIKGNTVRVGIEAPRDVRIIRGETVEKDMPADGRTLTRAAADPNTPGEKQPESGRDEPLDKPAAPWQSGRTERRSPLLITSPNDYSVPTNAV